MISFRCLFILCSFLLLQTSCVKTPDAKDFLIERQIGETIMVTNFTGHIERCDPGITVTFTVKSDLDEKTLTLKPDTHQLIKLEVEEGQQIKVNVNETETGQRLVASDQVFGHTPHANGQQDFPEIKLCPRDVLKFNNF